MDQDTGAATEVAVQLSYLGATLLIKHLSCVFSHRATTLRAGSGKVAKKAERLGLR